MQATAAGWGLREGPVRSERRATIWRTVARTLSVVVGLAGGGAVLFFGGLLAAFTGCVDNGETTTFCPGSADVATTLEILAVVAGVLAPLAGGIASCVTSRPRWLAAGLGVGLLMMWCLWRLAMGQQSLLS